MQKLTTIVLLLLCLILAACGSEADSHDHGSHADEDEHAHENEGGDLVLPELDAIALDGRMLRVVATTNIIGDVISNIGSDQIELTVLMTQGEDPHSYESTPQDLVAMEKADIIFVNGWDLEERLAADIEENFSSKMVAISAGVEPLDFDNSEHGHEDEEHEDEEHADEDEEHADEDDHGHSGADPHVWFDVHNVERWAENTAEVLSEADPANAEAYQASLGAYIKQLEALESEIETMLEELPAESRKLVTNHDALGYFAKAHNFEVVGTVLPALSTNADPSAGELAELIEIMEHEGVCTVFGETTSSNELAETVAAELDSCNTVQVLTIYTGSLGDGEANSYIGMFRSNVQTILEGLQ